MDFEDGEDEEGLDVANSEEDADSIQNEAYIPRTPLLVWAKGMDRRDRAQ